MNLTSSIRQYRSKQGKDAERERAHYRDCPSLEDAIRRAAQGKNHLGKRHSHQRRIRQQALDEAEVALLDAKAKIRRAGSFDRLFALIAELTREIKYIGELYRYDTALRIGFHKTLDLLPSRVYLHAGTRVGARTLGLLTRGKVFLEMEELHPALRDLPAYQIEDFLCISRKEFATGKGCGSSSSVRANQGTCR